MMKSIIALLGLIVVSSQAMLAGKIDDVIAEAKKAQGAEKAKTITSLIVIGSSEVSQMGQTFQIESKMLYKSPNKYKMMQSVMGSDMVTVINGESGWMINPMMGSSDPQAIPAEFFDQVATNVNSQKEMLLGAFANDEGKFEYKLIGREKVNEEDCYKISVLDLRDSTESTAFLSTKSYYLLKLTQDQPDQGGTVDVFFNDYKTFDGVVIAGKVEVMQGGQTVAKQVNKDIQINPTIVDTEFDMPKATSKE